MKNFNQNQDVCYQKVNKKELIFTIFYFKLLFVSYFTNLLYFRNTKTANFKIIRI
jgi:hypothetical protein